MKYIFWDYEQLYYILRIVVAGICGIIIGLERRNRSKEAGIRTHFVVACGAALIMVVSKYAFFDVIKDGMFGDIEVRLDPSRVASTIASGIGFLGAGMIFVHRNTITGLTTAAGIWATSGVGMAIGAGMYVVGIAATFVILIAQYLLHIDFHRQRSPKAKTLQISEVTETDFQKYLMDEFDKHKIVVAGVSAEKTSNDARNYTFQIEIPAEINEDMVLSLVKYKCRITNSNK